MVVKETTIIELEENGKKVAEIGLEVLNRQGWDVLDFLDYQEQVLKRRWKVKYE